MIPTGQQRWGERWRQAWRARAAQRDERGQTAIVAVVTVTVVAALTAGILVSEVTAGSQAQQAVAVNLSAANALTAGEHAYLVALNANPSLATCTSDSSSSGTCAGLQYGVWDPVDSTDTPGNDQEYYAFGNPQPTFDPATHALTKLTVQVAGAAEDQSEKNHYLFDQETFTVTPANGFLKNVWWSNYESYNDSNVGDYSKCNYNWSTSANPPASDFSSAYYTPGMGYNIDGQGNSPHTATCTPVYFAPSDYLFGPVYSNDSIFVSGTGRPSDSPSFGSSAAASAVTTADPSCLFVDDDHGMSGSASNCAAATGDVAQFAAQANSSDCTVQGTDTSSCANALETPPATDQALKQVAQVDGCVYEGPTKITVDGDQMTVSSPDSTASPGPVDASNHNVCPTDGTGSIPDNGVVYVDSVTPNVQNTNWVTGANPFDGLVYNTATNVSSSGSSTVTLTATVTSASDQLDQGTTVGFSYVSGRFTNSISSCSSQPLSSPTASGSNYTATATCTLSNPGSVSYYKATTSAGTYVTGSTGQSNTTSSYTPSSSYGSDSQVAAGGCSGCYYGQTSNADTEGDAFVSGNLSGQLTIGTANDVVVDGNITYDDCADASGNWSTGQSGSDQPQLGLCNFNIGADTTNDALGLIANEYVEVNHPVDSRGRLLSSCASTGGVLCDPKTTDAACDSGSGLTIDAAILALNQSFVVNNYNTADSHGNPEGCLTVYGSVQQFARGPVGTFSGNSIVSGYQKQYTWDPLLDYVSPPSYLVPSTASWVFQGSNQSAGGYANNVCPPLTGAVVSVDWSTGASTSGATLANTCDPTATGGLPDYPSTVAPTPPQDVTASQPGAGSTTVTVSWDPPVSINADSIQSYTVTSSPDGKTCTSAGTQCVFTGLTPGTTYSFTVTATNNAGYTSNPSAPSNAVVIPTSPSPPTNVTATVNNDGSVQVTWSNALGHGLPISGYAVSPSPACPACTYSFTTGSTTSSAQVSGLTGGTSYTFTVTATNGMGTSGASDPSNAITAPNVPGAPTAVTATPGSSQATVSWTAPDDGGVAITGYVVIPYIGGVAQTPQMFNSTSTTETVTRLSNGTVYTFAVEAFNPIGTGPASSQSAAVTPADVPGTPNIGTATANADGSATVTWTAPSSNGGSPITGYTVTPYLHTGSGFGFWSAQTSQTFSSSATTEIVTGLNSSSTYRFTVAAVNAIGTGNPSGNSNQITTASVPGAPGRPTGTPGNGQVSLSWSAPGSSGSSAINSYTITPYVGGVAQAPIVTGSNATSYVVTGLTNGTTYTFTVAATNTAGTGTASSQSSGLTPASPPGAPTGVNASANSDGSVAVSWTAPASSGGSAITGYVVTPYIGAVAQTPVTFNSTATAQTLTGLTGGSTYTFTISAFNAYGTGSASSSSNSVTPPSAPGAPTGVSATTGNASASVSWTAPASNGGSSITKYVVTPYIGSSAQPSTTFNSTATTETVTGLTNGTTYTFKVAAVNAVGTGAQSAASNSVTPMTVPGTPTGLSATRGNGQVSLTWTAPSNGGSAITSYVVTTYIAGVGQAPINTGSSATGYTVTGLTNGTAYTFTVAATNSVGTGTPTNQTGSVTPATTPGAPTGATATAGNAQVAVSWTAPSDNGGSAITGYTATASPGGRTCTTTGATSCTVTGLTNGTIYTFTVTATNAVGAGSPSAASNPATPATVPGAPTGVSGTAGNAQVTLSWSAPSSNGGASISSYTITPYIGTNAQNPVATGSSATSYTVTGLTNGTAYTFKVAATNSVGTGNQSSASGSVTPITVAVAPTGVNVSAASSTSASVNWTAPSDNGGSSVTGYVVTPYIGTTAQTPKTFSSTATTETVTGLSNGQTYTFTVAAVNGAGTGPASSPSNSVLMPSTPGAPTSVTATANADGSATVNWSAPSSDGGAPITSYTITPYLNGSSAKTATTTGTPVTSYGVTGLTAGSSYTFKVAATNVAGTGSQSNASNSVTLPTVPSTPNRPTVVANSDGSVTVTWAAPSDGGSPITDYTVTPYRGGNGLTPVDTGSTSTSYTITSGLSASTSYSFTVYATNGIGDGSESSKSSTVTTAAKPGSPRNVTATASGQPSGSVMVAFTPPSSGGTPDSYTVTANDTTRSSRGGQTATGMGSPIVVSGLTSRDRYNFTVTATNAVGTGSGTTSNTVSAP